MVLENLTVVGLRGSPWTIGDVRLPIDAKIASIRIKDCYGVEVTVIGLLKEADCIENLNTSQSINNRRF